MKTERDLTNKTNIYCYCIIKTPDETAGTVPIYGRCNGNLQVSNHIGRMGTAPKVIESIQGMDSNYNLYYISHKDVSMVVSKVSQNEFSENKLNDAIENITWLGRYAVRHEEIVGIVMKRYLPLLPMKFCTICEEEACIEMIMGKHYSKFIDTLNYFKDKEEYGVKMYVERDVFKKKMGTAVGAVPKAIKAEDNDNPGRNYLLKRKFEKQTQEILAIELSSRTKMMHSLISEWTAKSVSNRIINDSNTKDEMLVHNASCLVENKYLDKFHHTISRLNDSYASEGFRIVTSGPWPCYNFSPKIN